MKKKLLILICSVIQFTSMICSDHVRTNDVGTDAPDFRHHHHRIWPIRRGYRDCLETELKKAGLEENLTACQTHRDDALLSLERELGLPEGELQRRMDERAERHRQGRSRGEGHRHHEDSGRGEGK